MADSTAHLKQFQLSRSISGILLINGFPGHSWIIDLAYALIHPFRKQSLSLYFELVTKVNRCCPCFQEVTVQSRGRPTNKWWEWSSTWKRERGNRLIKSQSRQELLGMASWSSSHLILSRLVWTSQVQAGWEKFQAEKIIWAKAQRQNLAL